MKTVFTGMLGLAVAIAGLAVASPAHAVIVNYTVDGWGSQHFPGTAADTPAPPAPSTATWGDGYLGDQVELQSYAGTLDLTPGTSVQMINTRLWTGYYTYAGAGDPDDPDAGWQELAFHFGTPRNITIDGQTTLLSQGGLLFCGYYDDQLSFVDGSTVSLYVQGYRVDVTPLALQVASASWSGSTPPGGFVQPSDVMNARFVVTPVPEPTTVIAGTLLLLPFGASTLRLLRKSRKA